MIYWKYVAPAVYDELEDITGLDRGTIKNLKSVAAATSSRRHDDLSFSHHVEVAPLEPEKQEYFLNKASEENKVKGHPEIGGLVGVMSEIMK